MDHLEVLDGVIELMIIFYGSQITIAYMKDSKYHRKTKHLDIKYNYISNIVADKEISMKCISIYEMTIDPRSITKDVFLLAYKIIRFAYFFFMFALVIELMLFKVLLQ